MSLRPILLSFVVLLGGCAGYQVGPTNQQIAGDRSVSFRFFDNQTTEPRLSEPLDTSLRRAIQRDGTLRLETATDGDWIVTGTIKSFQRSALTLQPADVRTLRDANVQMTVDVEVLERGTGDVILKQSFQGRTSLRAGADLASAERQVIPLLAEHVAQQVVTVLADGDF